MKKKHPFPIYPVFLAPIPILILLQANIQQVNSLHGLRLIVASMIFAGILLTGIGFALRRKWRRAALIAAIVIVLINLYGFLVWWSALPVVAFSIWLAWNARPSHRFSNYANFVTCVGLVTFLAVIGWQAGPRDWAFARNTHSTGTGNEPDIYFIVLDSHTSHELLLERFGYDNTPFLDSLTSLGFRVGDCQSTYPNTDYSLASILNPQATTFPSDAKLWQMIRNSQVRSVLEQRGYETVGFATGFVWSEWLDTDIYYQPPVLFSDLNIFELYYLQRTPVDLILKNSYLEERLSEIYRERTLTLLSHLPDAATLAGPQFVFAHVLQPHPPFVFDVDGNPADWHLYSLPGNYNPTTRSGYTKEGYDTGYVVEIRFIEKAILPPIEAILADAPNSTIILAADHGPWFSETEAEALSTLCAVYSPKDLPLEPRAIFEEIIK